MTDLELAIGNINAMIRTIVNDLPNVGYPDDSEGPLTNLSHLYRMRGIGKFLLEADAGSYVHDLQLSVQARSTYLQGALLGARCSPKFRRSTRNRAFFDALAVNDVAAATELAERCDGIWVDDLEYEDDFLFVDFLQKALLVHQGLRPRDAARSTLDRHSSLLDDPQEDPFYQLAAALYQRDEVALDKALEAITIRRSANYAKIAALGDLPQVILLTERFLDVQGIGILRLAIHIGLNPSRFDYPRIPGDLVTLSLGSHPPAPAELWRRG